MPRYSVVLRIENIYEVEAEDENEALVKARHRLEADDEPDMQEESDEPSVSEM